jgi:hypothetical protein
MFVVPDGYCVLLDSVIRIPAGREATVNSVGEFLSIALLVASFMEHKTAQ